MTIRAAVAALLALAPAMASADEPTMRKLTDAGLQAVFSGATLAGVYENGQYWSEHTMADGTTDLRNDGEPPAPGRWWTADDKICFDYGANGLFCFEVWQRSANCFDNYTVIDGDVDATWVARVAGIGWNSRGARTDAPSTCPAAEVADAGTRAVR